MTDVRIGRIKTPRKHVKICNLENGQFFLMNKGSDLIQKSLCISLPGGQYFCTTDHGVPDENNTHLSGTRFGIEKFTDRDGSDLVEIPNIVEMHWR